MKIILIITDMVAGIVLLEHMVNAAKIMRGRKYVNYVHVKSLGFNICYIKKPF